MILQNIVPENQCLHGGSIREKIKSDRVSEQDGQRGMH